MAADGFRDSRSRRGSGAVERRPHDPHDRRDAPGPCGPPLRAAPPGRAGKPARPADDPAAPRRHRGPGIPADPGGAHTGTRMGRWPAPPARRCASSTSRSAGRAPDGPCPGTLAGRRVRSVRAQDLRNSRTRRAKASGISSTTGTVPSRNGRETAARDVPRDRLGLREREGVLRPAGDQGRAADPTDLLLHPVAAARAVALDQLLPRPQRVGDEANQEVRSLLGIEALADLPELGDVGAVGLRLDVVDAVPARPAALAIGRVDEGTRREDEPLDPLGVRRRQLHGDHRARVVPHHRGRAHPEAVEQRDRSARVVLDLRGARGLVGLPVADRVHGDHATLAREQRDHVAILVPRARRLMQQQHGRPGPRGRVVDLAVRGVGVRSPHRGGHAVRHHGSPVRARQGLSTVIR